MATIISILFSLVLTAAIPSEEIQKNIIQDSVTTYYLIRHAEKDRSNEDEQDPALTEAGEKRAQKWADALKDVKFDAVYSTNYKRTMQTATPLAKQNDLEIQQYDPNEAYNEDFKNKTTGKTVMIVGHSNTTPAFTNKILGKEKYEQLDDAENGALFIVQILPDGKIISKVIYIN